MPVVSLVLQHVSLEPTEVDLVSSNLPVFSADGILLDEKLDSQKAIRACARHQSPPSPPQANVVLIVSPV